MSRTASTQSWRSKPPTPRQLAEIERLSVKRGLPVERPATRGEASDRLTALTRPAPWQLRKLRRLAESRGVSFSTPQTFKDAARQIAGLERIVPSSAAERAADRQAVYDAARPAVPERVGEAQGPPPGRAQLTVLKRACRERGIPFVAPATAQEAREQLAALSNRRRRAPVNDETAALLPASSVLDDEVVGYGASATWA
jgi:hypothetical protein